VTFDDIAVRVQPRVTRPLVVPVDPRSVASPLVAGTTLIRSQTRLFEPGFLLTRCVSVPAPDWDYRTLSPLPLDMDKGMPCEFYGRRTQC
jgi:hypothetical protein